MVARTAASQVCICVDPDNFVLCRRGRKIQPKLRKKIPLETVSLQLVLELFDKVRVEIMLR